MSATFLVALASPLIEKSIPLAVTRAFTKSSNVRPSCRVDLSVLSISSCVCLVFLPRASKSFSVSFALLLKRMKNVSRMLIAAPFVCGGNRQRDIRYTERPRSLPIVAMHPRANRPFSVRGGLLYRLR